jgi:hypothetical protein
VCNADNKGVRDFTKANRDDPRVQGYRSDLARSSKLVLIGPAFIALGIFLHPHEPETAAAPVRTAAPAIAAPVQVAAAPAPKLSCSKRRRSRPRQR